MAVRQYIGARYITKVYENTQNPASAEWEADTEYEPLTLVTYNNGSYLSRKVVPAEIGNPTDNPTYWAQTGFYNGQIIYLQSEIDSINAKISMITEFTTPEDHGAAADGVTDDTQAFIDAFATGLAVKLTDGKEYAIGSYDVDFIAANNTKLFAAKGATIKSILSPFNDPAIVANPNMHSMFTFENMHDVEFINIKFLTPITYYQRPLSSGGSDWTTYLNYRNKSLGNFRMRNCTNINFTNCEFDGGLNSLHIAGGTNYNIKGCFFHNTYADSLYIVDASSKMLIEGCHIENNGDDGYCVNVEGVGSDICKDITFMNCTGHEVSGALCMCNWGEGVTFIDCSGTVRRTAGLRVECPDVSTTGDYIKNVSFIGCSVKLLNDSYTTAMCLCATAADIAYEHSIKFINCRFDMAATPYNGGTAQFINYYFSGVTYDQCYFKGSLYVAHGGDITFNGCIIDAPNNSDIRIGQRITFNSCKFINNGVLPDTFNNRTGTADHRRTLNVYNCDVLSLHDNTYVNGDPDNVLPWYDVGLDPVQPTGDFITKADTDKLYGGGAGLKNVFFDIIPNAANLAGLAQNICGTAQIVYDSANSKLVIIIEHASHDIVSL